MNIPTIPSLTDNKPCGCKPNFNADRRWRMAGWLALAVILLSAEFSCAQESPVLVYQTKSTFVLTSSNRQVRIPAKGYRIFSYFKDDQSGSELTNITLQARWPGRLRSDDMVGYDLITLAGQKFCVISEFSEVFVQRIWLRGTNSQTVLIVNDEQSDSPVVSYFRGRNSLLRFGVNESQTLQFPKVITLAERSLGSHDPALAHLEKNTTLVYSQSRTLKFNPPFDFSSGLAGLRNEIIQEGYTFIDLFE